LRSIRMDSVDCGHKNLAPANPTPPPALDAESRLSFNNLANFGWLK
jgi:hypothetical protein